MNSLDNLGNTTGAIRYFNKVLAINPHNVNALGNKGAVLNDLGNDTGAIQYFEKASYPVHFTIPAIYSGTVAKYYLEISWTLQRQPFIGVS